MQNTTPWGSLKDIIGLSFLSNSNQRSQCPHAIIFSHLTAPPTIPPWETAGSRHRPDNKSRRTTTGPSKAYTSSPNPSNLANWPLLLDTGQESRNFWIPSRRDSEYFTTHNNLALVTQQQKHNTCKQQDTSGGYNTCYWSRTPSSPCFSFSNKTSSAGSLRTRHSCNHSPTHPTTFDWSHTSFSRRILGYTQHTSLEFQSFVVGKRFWPHKTSHTQTQHSSTSRYSTDFFSQLSQGGNQPVDTISIHSSRRNIAAKQSLQPNDNVTQMCPNTSSPTRIFPQTKLYKHCEQTVYLIFTWGMASPFWNSNRTKWSTKWNPGTTTPTKKKATLVYKKVYSGPPADS